MRTAILVIVVALVAAGAEPEVPTGLSGRVVDAEGAPVAGATVELLVPVWRDGGLPWGADPDDPAPSATTTTDEKGRFSLPLAPDRQGGVRVRVPGGELIRSALSPAGEKLEIRIAGRGEIVARVVDGEGAAVAGAEVRASGPEFAVDPRRIVGTTGPDGSVVLGGAPPGLYSVLATADGYGPAIGGRVYIPNAGSTTVRLLLPPGRVIRGIVRAAATKRPVEGAEVGWYVGLAESVVTGSDGGFRLHGSVDQSAGVIYARAPGFSLGSARGTSRPVIELSPGAAVEGRVVSATGAPVPAAPIAAVADERGEGGADLVFGTTRPDGGFRLEGLRRGRTHRLLVRAPGHGRRPFEFDVPEEGVEVVPLGDIRLPPAHTLSVAVVSADGEPLGNSTVGLISTWDSRELRADDSGRIRIFDLAPGKYSLRTNAPGAPADLRKFLIPEDESEVEVVVRLAGERSLTVRVLSPEGESVRYFGLLYMGGEPRPVPASILTGPDGLARFVGLPAGGGLLSVCTQQRIDLPAFRPPKALGVTPEEAAVTVKLLPAVPTRILVVDPNGEPLPYHQLYVDYPDGANSLLTTDWRGRATAPADPGGTFDVEIGEIRVPVDAEGLPDTNAALDREKAVPEVKGRLEGVHAGAEDVVLRAEPR